MNNSALDWQKQIYLHGFAGNLPTIPIDPAKLELAAKSIMTPKAFAYVAGGAGEDRTISSNRAAFGNVQIIPRMLRDVAMRDTSMTLFGQKISSPLLLSPVGVLDLAHPDADIAVAKAAASVGIPYIFSNQASRPMEECAAMMGNRWAIVHIGFNCIGVNRPTWWQALCNEQRNATAALLLSH
jgi:lactate 2-monooxygenase